jgi:hypothetical protein
MRFNATTSGIEIYTAGANIWQPAAARGVRAAGGTVYDVDVEGTTYRVHVFTTIGNSTFTVTRSGTVEYLIVAGGGSGGSGEGNPAGDSPGGGGAGGLLTGFTTVTPQAYTITVGAGASIRVTTVSADGLNGQNSSAFGLTTIGGGAGGREEGPGFAGGSGGGAGGSCTTGRKTGGSGTAGQGNSGGTGGDSGCSRRAGAGGGGAGIAGGDDRGNVGGIGGNGLLIGITGIDVYYAGGGGGGNSANVGGAAGPGGLGGGGAGGTSPSGPGTDATPNTGGGGGGTGSGTSLINGLGGSGIVVIRYPLQSEPDVTAPKVANNRLVLDLDFAKSTVYVGSGTIVNDSRLNDINGTLVNSPVFADSRTHRSSFRFNGVNNSIQFPFKSSMDFSAAQSICMWLRPTTGSNSVRRNPYNQAYGGSGTLTYETDGTINYYFGTNGGDNLPYVGINSVFTIAENELTFITVTRDQATNISRWYKNGVLITTSNAGGYDATANGSSPIIIGAGYTSPFLGNIFVCKVYNIALTQQEVSEMFNAQQWRFGV